MARKRVTYRPGKTSGIFGSIVGGIFVLIGIAVAIPTFGTFGILWTLIAAGITVYNAYSAFGKGYVGPVINIEDDAPDSAAAGGSESRLRELQGLYDRGLITQEEYEAKRREILREL